MSYPGLLHRIVKICPLGSQTQPASVDGFCLLVSRGKVQKDVREAEAEDCNKLITNYYMCLSVNITVK